MKKICWIFGIILLFVGLSACDKNDFESNPGLDDMDLKGAELELDEAGSAFAYGTHVFTSNPKANPDGLVPLNLTQNRWGWANNLSETSSENPSETTITSVKYNISGEYFNYDYSIRTNIEHLNAIEIWNDDDNFYIKTNIPGMEWGFMYMRVPNSREAEINLVVNGITTVPINIIPNYNGETTIYFWTQINISSPILPYFWRNPSYNIVFGSSYNIIYSDFTLWLINPSWDQYNDYSVKYLRIPNAIQITNDATNLYVTVNYNLTNTQLRITNQGVLNWLFIDGPSGWNSVTKFTAPLNDIPNYKGSGNPLEITVMGNYEIGENSINPYYFWDEKYTASSHNMLNYTPIVSNIELPIYMGAALNDTTKGTLVGKAILTYDGTTATVKYVLDGYMMNEVHIYASDLQPTTIAPGQYGFTEIFNEPVNEFETIFNIEDAEDDGIWLILHAVIAL